MLLHHFLPLCQVRLLTRSEKHTVCAGSEAGSHLNACILVSRRMQMDPTCKALVDDLAKLMEQHIDAFDARGRLPGLSNRHVANAFLLTIHVQMHVVGFQHEQTTLVRASFVPL